MHRHQSSLTAIAVILAAAVLTPLPAASQTWPQRPVTLVVPFAAGGTTDIIARLVGREMARTLGQNVVVENRGGAGGALGSTQVARSPADGYTILAATVSTHAINPALVRTLPYDALRDFAPVSLLVSVPNVLVVSPKVQASTVQELVALAKAQPGRFSYASPGNGSIGHLQAHWLGRVTGMDIQHIPYRGAGPAMQDVVAGQVEMMIDNLPTALAQIQSGAVRALMVTAPARVPQLPTVPTAAEAGVGDVVGGSWTALLAPRATPPAVIQRLAEAARVAIADPALQARLADIAATPIGAGPKDTAEHLAAELALWAPIVRASGVVQE
ncbi:MAG: tripartite tricarboxylate transporter substrate binding protein [Alphaproteobacteria bacterium]|nr:MAG: tripartite tricarboxylate transporter substrate binding protein [Alphaproteobacteria bacterium]